MTGAVKVRISLGSGELEVEGTEAFVAQYEDDIRLLLTKLKEDKVAFRSHQGADVQPSRRSTTGPIHDGSEFGEVLHALPKSATGSDQILVAGSFVARSATDQTFSTTEANKLLIEQGIKLSNPSQSLKNNLVAKRVFKVGSRFRVSQTGEQHIRGLVGHAA